MTIGKGSRISRDNVLPLIAISSSMLEHSGIRPVKLVPR